MMKKNLRLDAFVEALLTCKTVEDAAASIQISHATAYRWLKSDYVVQHLASARRDSNDALHAPASGERDQGRQQPRRTAGERGIRSRAPGRIAGNFGIFVPGDGGHRRDRTPDRG